MDLFVCSECKTVVDADKCRDDYIDVCPMDTADAGYEIGYYCSSCGYYNIRSYVDDAPDGAKEGDKV